MYNIHEVHWSSYLGDPGRLSEPWFLFVSLCLKWFTAFYMSWHYFPFAYVQIMAGRWMMMDVWSNQKRQARLYAAVYHRQARHCSRKASLRCSKCFVFRWFAKSGHLSLELEKVLLCFVLSHQDKLWWVASDLFCDLKSRISAPETEHLELCLSSCRQQWKFTQNWEEKWCNDMQ